MTKHDWNLDSELRVCFKDHHQQTRRKSRGSVPPRVTSFRLCETLKKRPRTSAIGQLKCIFSFSLHDYAAREAGMAGIQSEQEKDGR